MTRPEGRDGAGRLRKPAGATAAAALGAVLLTGLAAAFSSTPSATAPSPPAASASNTAAGQTAAAQVKQVGADGVVFRTASGLSELFNHESTPAATYVLLDQPCAIDAWPKLQMIPELQPSGIASSLPPQPAPRPGFRPNAHAHAGEIDTFSLPAGAPGGPYCAVTAATTIAEDAPARGTLILRACPPGPASVITTPAAVSTATYVVQRSSSGEVYLGVFGLASVVGLVVGGGVLLGLRCAFRQRKELPATYEYDKPWASATALAVAITTPLLAGSGVLATFSPQYQTTGITLGNLAITVILAAGPVLVAAFYAKRSRACRSLVLSVVGCLVVTGVSAQLLLDVVYVLSTGLLDGSATTVTLAVTAAVAALTVAFVWKALVVDLPQRPKPPRMGLPRRSARESTSR